MTRLAYSAVTCLAHDTTCHNRSRSAANNRLLFATGAQGANTGDCDHCATITAQFQESLTTYLEWKINEQLNIVNKTRAGEIEAIRPKDLSAEGRDDARMLRSLEVTTAITMSLPVNVLVF